MISRYGSAIKSSKQNPSAAYLGVKIDMKLTFAEHLRKAAEKAQIWVNQLSRILARSKQ